MDRGNASTVERIVKEAHLIGNHSYSHLDLTALTPEQVANEIATTTELIEKYGDGTPHSPSFSVALVFLSVG